MKKFEGKDVVSASVVITKAGDGLSDALDIEPDEIHQGEVRYYLLESRCEKVQFVPAGKSEKLLDRKHTMDTVAITQVPAEMAEATIEEAKERIAEYREEEARKAEAAKGVDPLPLA